MYVAASMATVVVAERNVAKIIHHLSMSTQQEERERLKLILLRYGTMFKTLHEMMLASIFSLRKYSYLLFAPYDKYNI